MGKINLKHIGKFEDFCKSRNKRLIKEQNEVAIDVPFWQDALDAVIQDIRQISGNPIDWSVLLNFLKVKFIVLDRELPTGEDQVLAHIRDVLFQRFGDTILGGDIGCLTYDAGEMGAKALVFSQLASEILHRVRVEAGLEPEIEPEPDPKPLAKVSLGYDDEYYDDLPYETRNVAGFGDFVALLKEDVDRLSLQDGDKTLDRCLNKIESAAGSLKLDDVLKVVEEEEFPNLNSYLTSVVETCLLDATIDLNGKELKDTKGEQHVAKQAKKIYAHEIVKKLVETIKKENE